MRPSDTVKLSRIYQDEPNLQLILKRYQQWTPENWTWEQASLDIGYLMGLIAKLDAAQETRQ